MEMTIAEDLVLAVLAVNNWSLDKVFALRDALRDAGLFDLDEVAPLSVEEVAKRLADAGYARGEYMNGLLAQRVLSTAQVLSNEKLAKVAENLRAGRRDDVNTTLRQIKGVGPSVLLNFWILQEQPAR